MQINKYGHTKGYVLDCTLGTLKNMQFITLRLVHWWMSKLETIITGCHATAIMQRILHYKTKKIDQTFISMYVGTGD